MKVEGMASDTRHLLEASKEVPASVDEEALKRAAGEAKNILDQFEASNNETEGAGDAPALEGDEEPGERQYNANDYISYLESEWSKLLGETVGNNAEFADGSTSDERKQQISERRKEMERDAVDMKTIVGGIKRGQGDNWRGLAREVPDNVEHPRAYERYMQMAAVKQLMEDNVPPERALEFYRDNLDVNKSRPAEEVWAIANDRYELTQPWQPRVSLEAEDDVIRRELKKRALETSKQAQELEDKPEPKPTIEPEPKPTIEPKSEPEPKPEPEHASEQEHDEYDEGFDYPLLAVSIDRRQSMEDKALAQARERVDRELSEIQRGGNFVQKAVSRLWKGRVLRGYYERKYQGEYIEQMRQENEKFGSEFIEHAGNFFAGNGDEMTDLDYVMMRMTTVDDDHYVGVRERAGERREEVDDETRQKAVDIIHKLATEELDGDNFQEEIKRLRALTGDEGDRDRIDNYETIALYVKGELEHQEGVENVEKRFNELMGGFKMYEAKSVEGARTKVNRTRSDELFEKWTHSEIYKSKVSAFVSPEAMAAAAGIAGSIASSLAKSKTARLITFGGSAAAAGALVAAHEGAMTANDRATMAQLKATGRADEVKGYERGSKKLELEQTVMGMVSASDLIDRMEQVVELGDIAQMKQALMDAFVLQEFSDANGVDLISYSSPESIEKERYSILLGQAEIEDYLTESGADYFDIDDYKRQVLDGLDAVANASKQERASVIAKLPDGLRELYEEKDKRDTVYRKLRRSRMIRAGVSTAAIAGAAQIAFQEGLGFFDDNTRNLFETVTGQNAEATHQTLLGGAADRIGRGLNSLGIGEQTANAVSTTATTEYGTPAEYKGSDVSQEQLNEWASKGYKVEQHYVGGAETQVSAAEAMQSNPTFHRAGWNGSSDGTLYANGTKVTWVDNTPDGGEYHFAISATEATQANPEIVSAHLEGNTLVADVEPGSRAAQMLENGSYKYLEVVDSNNIVYATEVGSGTATSFTETTASELYYTVTPVTITTIEVPATGVEEITRDFATVPSVPIIPGRRGIRVESNQQDEAIRGDVEPELVPIPEREAPASAEPELRTDQAESEAPASPEGIRREEFIRRFNANLSGIMSDLGANRNNFDRFMANNGLSDYYDYSPYGVPVLSDAAVRMLDGIGEERMERELQEIVNINRNSDEATRNIVFLSTEAEKYVDEWQHDIAKELNDRAYDGGWQAAQYAENLGDAEQLFVRENGDNSSLILSDEGKAAIRKFISAHMKADDLEDMFSDRALDTFIAEYNSGLYH